MKINLSHNLAYGRFVQELEQKIVLFYLKSLSGPMQLR